MSNASQEAVAAMQELGYPEHVIQGFLMNYQDESGMRANAVESEDNVHGTRGKGIYQLTGSRKEQFESQYKGDWSIRNQVKFQDWELNNTETGARDAIFASKNAGDAGAAIVNKFLRPAEEHRAAREASYRGNPPPPTSGVPEPAEEAAGVPEITGNETVDGLIDTMKGDVTDGLGQAALGALLGTGGNAPPPPPPMAMRPPPVRQRAPGPIFKITRPKQRDK